MDTFTKKVINRMYETLIERGDIMNIRIVKCESGWLVISGSSCGPERATEWAFTTSREMLQWLSKNLDKITKKK